MNEDDKERLLQQISDCHHAPIISLLVNISNEANQREHVKSRFFLSNLQCLQPEGVQLRRKMIDAYHQPKYVALSYTWVPSVHEDDKSGRYCVEGWDGNYLEPSKVRNCVLDRVLGYMHHFGVDFLWIDAHCIRQDTCGVDDCDHHFCCVQKRDGIQAMDLVYQLSEYPVALLGWPLKASIELDVLRLILSGKLVDDEERLSGEPSTHREALKLLSNITQDRWFERTWTFQENYRGGPWMRLLICHDPQLESRKLQRPRVFGDVPGELCVSFIDFSCQATRLCLAMRRMARLLPQDEARIQGVLRAAGRYALMLPGSHCMTPTVIADVESRSLSNAWDRQAIVANVCQYPLQLDVQALRRQGHSPSLAMLALCLLGGEILDNSDNAIASAAGLTVSQALEKLMFQAFEAPEGNPRRLTFNKGCRLTDVELTLSGIKTRGHLWKLGHVVNTEEFPRRLPWIKAQRGRLTARQRCLLQLVDYLEDHGYSRLVDELNEYLDREARACASFSDKHLNSMAEELAAAIMAGKKLRLGCIWNPFGGHEHYRGVFVCPDQDFNGRYHSPASDFVFTSVRPADLGSRTHEANDINCHVSLRVNKLDGHTPRLQTHSWMLGMCFFEGCPLIEVVFPWPRALQVG
jgi:hypothetical protein